ncbi:MAG: sugar phosphate isomerase/epimerase family protein [Armatimonadota bacterium]|nr:sugar phosphate isomerase/epimerase family protein [Armatimonadota bacterium]MDR7545396.1 sugar phosphate isomerase/epimerase family protein [Armatimonadota bacterium]
MKINCCWLYAINKYGYPPSIADTYKVLGEMAAMGFDAVELEGVREENLRAVWAARADLKRRCDDLGLRIINFCPVLPDLVSPDDGRRRAALDLFRLATQAAVDFGAPTIQVDSYAAPVEYVQHRPYHDAVEFRRQFHVRIPPGFSWERTWASLVETIRACASLAEDAGLRLCLEPRVGELVSNTDALLRLMDRVDSPVFGAVLDCGHLHAQKEILPLSVEKLGSRIFYVHASDNDSRDNDHLAPGRGTVDWEALIAGLRRHGFDGYIGIDVGGVPDLEAQYVEGLAFIRRLLERADAA